jgi:hypothetical protein
MWLPMKQKAFFLLTYGGARPSAMVRKLGRGGDKSQYDFTPELR